MEPVDHLKLQKNWTHLLDSVNCEDIIPFLLQDFVLDFDTVEEIEAAETRKKRTRLLLTTLMRRGPDAYRAFRRALSEFEVYEHLVQRLDNTEIDPAVLSSLIQSKRSDKPDIGITPLDDDAPSGPSPLRSDSFSSGSSDTASEPPLEPQHMLPPPSSSTSSSLPSSNSSSNFRIAGNHNFVIMGSNNTQVYYH